MLNTKGLVTGITLGLLLQAALGSAGVADSAAGSFPISTDQGKQYGPIAVADTNGNRFLVVWTDLRSGREAVYGQIIDARGMLFGNQIQISNAGRNINPSVAYDSVRRMYLILWTNVTSDGQSGIFGRFISADGRAENPQTIVARRASRVDNGKAVLDPKQGRFLIIWDCHCGQGKAANNWDVRGGFFTADLVPISQSYVITDAFNNDQFANVSFDPASETFLVVWKHTESSTQLPGGTIHGQLITADMRLFRSKFPISSSPAVTPATVVADPLNGTFLIGWVDNNSELAFRALTSDGNLPGAPFTTAHGVRGQPSMVYNSTTEKFLAVYDSNGDVILDQLSTASAVGPASVVITRGAQRGDRAGLAYDPKSRSIFIAWSQASAPGTDDSDIYGTIIVLLCH
jgi:hypothetical protein